MQRHSAKYRSSKVLLATASWIALVAVSAAKSPCEVSLQQHADQPTHFQDEGFESIFDGKTLAGWRSIPEDRAKDWRVEQGVLISVGSKTGLAYLVFDQELTDFELRLSYRLPGNGNTGVEIRAQVDPSGKRPLVGYHADLGHVGIGSNVLGAWDLHFAERPEPGAHRGKHLTIHPDGSTDVRDLPVPLQVSHIRDRDWNDVRVVAKGTDFKFYINGRLASRLTDNAKQARLDRGLIGLQIHDQGARTDFKDIFLKRTK